MLLLKCFGWYVLQPIPVIFTERHSGNIECSMHLKQPEYFMAKCQYFISEFQSTVLI